MEAVIKKRVHQLLEILEARKQTLVLMTEMQEQEAIYNRGRVAELSNLIHALQVILGAEDTSYTKEMLSQLAVSDQVPQALLTQDDFEMGVRHRISEYLDGSWSRRCYVSTVVWGLRAQGFCDIASVPAVNLAALILSNTTNITPAERKRIEADFPPIKK